MGFLEVIKNYKNIVEQIQEKDDILVIYTTRENILILMKKLKELGFDYLIDLCGVDYLNFSQKKKRFRFEIVYHLYSFSHNTLLRIKIGIPEEEPWQYSVSHIWKSAEGFERECYDMFGIKFIGHPNLKRVFMPDDWKGHPLRKDYPLVLDEEMEWETYKNLEKQHKNKKDGYSD